MAQDNASTARAFYEAWNDRDFDRGAQQVSDDASIVIAGSGTTFRGPDGSREFSQMWAGAFPDGRITFENVVAAGDRVVVEFTGRGTHTGPLTTPTGTVAPTGRSVTLQLCDILEFDGGKITALRTYFDTASLLTQLGALPAPAQH